MYTLPNTISLISFSPSTSCYMFGSVFNSLRPRFLAVKHGRTTISTCMLISYEWHNVIFFVS